MLTLKKSILSGILVTTLVLLSGCGVQNAEHRATGSVEADVIVLSAETGGIIKDMVKEGTQVKAGDVIAKITAPTAEAQLAQTKAAYQAAEARLSELKAGSRAEQLRSAEAGVEAVQAQLAGANQAVIDAQNALDTVRSQMDATPANNPAYPTLKGNEQELIAKLDAAQAQVAVLAAQKRSTEAQRDLLKAGATKQAIDAAQAAVDQAKASLQLAQTQADKATIKSPTDGVVQTAVLHSGELAGPGSVVAKLATSQWHVQIYVPEKNLSDFTLGKVIHLQAEALPNVTFDGKVEQINPTAEFTPKNVSTPKGRENLVFGIKVSVPNQDAVRPGMTLIATW